MIFRDRDDAGRRLSARVAALSLVDPLVLALPRGGVPVGREVAAALQAPMDLLFVRKIGASGQPERTVAAVAEGPPAEIFIDDEILAATGTTLSQVERAARLQLKEIARQRHAYLVGRVAQTVEGRCAVVVDDGVATGVTLKAGLQALRRLRPVRTVLAVPVASPAASARLSGAVDDWVCLAEPARFVAIGHYYEDFREIDDMAVAAIMQRVQPVPSAGHR